MKYAGQNFLYLCKLSSTKFDLESNWNILNEKRRPEFPISLQTFLNEIRFRIKLKHSEWKTQARSSYFFANFPQFQTLFGTQLLRGSIDACAFETQFYITHLAPIHTLISLLVSPNKKHSCFTFSAYLFQHCQFTFFNHQLARFMY